MVGSLLLSVCCLAQHTISGKVTEEKKGAKNASVELLQSKDSVLLKSVLAGEEGYFELGNVGPGDYLLRVSMIGFRKSYTPVKVTEGNVSLPEILLVSSAGALQGITVTATKPFLEQKADRLVVNVENSATAAGSTALEVLQKVPGIIFTNDKVSMVGRNNVNIMIDGRPSQYTDMTQVLRDMPASNIEKIEVIANPGARYDAAGGAVINIVLKRNANLGTNGTVTLSGGRGLYSPSDPFVDRGFYRLSPAVNLNHRKGNSNVYGSYNYFHRNFFEQNRFDRQVDGNRFVQTNYAPGRVDGHTYRLGADFYLDNKNTVGVLVRGFNRHGLIITDNETVQSKLSDGQRLSTFTTLTMQDFARKSLAGNVNWKHVFDSAGKELNVDLDYSTFDIDNSSNIVITQSSGARSISNQAVDNPVKFGVLKLDYVHPLNKNSKLEAGAKSTLAQIDNYLAFTRNKIPDAAASNDFFYNEKINAAYLNYIGNWNAWEFTGGLRAEQTIASGKSGTVKTLDRNYVQLFPSVFLTRRISKELAAVGQYSRRVNRPSYQQQNPFTFFIDSLTYTQGNPLIRPEITNTSRLALTYEGQPFFALNYNVTNDVIFENAPRQQGNLAYATPENLGRYSNIAIELNFPIKLGKKINGFGGNQAVYNHYRAQYLGSIYDQKRWNWIAYGQVAYKATPTLTFEVSGFYSTRFLNEFITIDPLGNLNFAIQKSFWERKGRLSLNFSDLFYSNQTRATIRYQDILLNFNQRSESRNVRLAFTYSFGNQKLKAARSRTTGSETETNRVKTNN